jgi:hypothetical protein
MNLLTLDEARRLACRSAATLEHVRPASVRQLRAFLFGRGSTSNLNAFERRLVDGHRRVLVHLDALGYGAEVGDEMDGISSALGLDERRCDWNELRSVLPDGVYAVDVDEVELTSRAVALAVRMRARASFTYFASVS